jgi:hypothetical protein
MTTQEYLCRHFARMGARVVVRGPRLRQRTKIAIDVGRDRSGEVFVIGCEEGLQSKFSTCSRVRITWC